MTALNHINELDHILADFIQWGAVKESKSCFPWLNRVYLWYFTLFVLFYFILHGHMHTMCVNFIFLRAAYAIGLIFIKRPLVSAGGT